MEYTTMMIVYITVSTACVVGCIIATLLVYLDFVKQKRESAAEVEHLKAEVRACRELLRARGKNEPARVGARTGSEKRVFLKHLHYTPARG